MEAPKAKVFKFAIPGVVPKVLDKPAPPPPQDLSVDITSHVDQMFKRKPVTQKNRPIAVAAAAAIVRNKTLKRVEEKKVVPAPAPAIVPAPVATAKAEVTVKVQPSARSLTQVPPELKALQSAIEANEQSNPYTDKVPGAFIPEDRSGFTRFIRTYYSPNFSLPPILKSVKFNPNACEGSSTIQAYKYQQFIREYMRQASPYRGVLVYHGLGSGKTCTSIAAAEALYGSNPDRKIIVLTPTSLKENFLNELMVCGFRHYHLINKWIPFEMNTPSLRLFAEHVVGIPETHIGRVLRKKIPMERVFWMPDLSVSQEESKEHFNSLSAWEQSAIREQIYAILQNKIDFLGYTGLPRAFLLDKVLKDPTYFDNKIIVIDEIHNLLNLMAGKLDPYLVEPKARGATGEAAAYRKATSKYEPVGVDTWVPKEKGSGKHYSRAYLFYRLFCQAKNTKIIALSGTPIINAPVSVGILANILHGYFHSATDYIKGSSDDQVKKLLTILKNHPRVNYQKISVTSAGTEVFFTILDQGYTKQFADDGSLQGIIYDEEESDISTIQQLYEDIEAKAKAAGITLRGSPLFQALPLLPPTIDAFRETFIDYTTFNLRNELTFKKRISGVISYYKGSKKELMPEIISDTIIPCAMSRLSIPQYTEARLKELKQEKKKKKNPSSDIQNFEQKEAASYRFRTRAICNFAFPTDIERPFPSGKKELREAVAIPKEVVGGEAVDIIENPEGIEDIEGAEEDIDWDDWDEEEEETDEKPKALKPYKERIQDAIRALRERAETIFNIDPTLPENEQLQTYSPKFAAIYDKIMESKGSNLVYSQFKTLEGIGLFSVVLDAQGFAPIRLTGPDTDLDLDDETKISFLEYPEQPRYIVYSGGEKIRVRQTLINLFNMRLEKLPTKIREFMESLDIIETKNQEGEVCKVFMITAAGAEGLSLKNVRSVHVMESFWNKVRTDQVKGRAVRICSHMDLEWNEDPELNQRTVEVYTYMSVFDKDMLKSGEIPETLLTNDDGLTSDEYIMDLSNKKDQLNTSFLTAMKESSVDCLLNASENERLTCIVHEGTVNDFLYDPRLDKDIEARKNDERVEAKPPAGTVVQAPTEKGYMIRERKFYGILQSDGRELLYAEDDIDRKNPLGEIAVNPTTGKKGPKWYK